MHRAQSAARSSNLKVSAVLLHPRFASAGLARDAISTHVSHCNVPQPRRAVRFTTGRIAEGRHTARIDESRRDGVDQIERTATENPKNEYSLRAKLRLSSRPLRAQQRPSGTYSYSLSLSCVVRDGITPREISIVSRWRIDCPKGFSIVSMTNRVLQVLQVEISNKPLKGITVSHSFEISV